MHTTILRAQFPDRALTADDLRPLAFLLADWFGQTVSRERGTFAASVSLWGFPRADGDGLAARLRARAEAAGLGEMATVSLPDPDTLVLDGTPLPLWGSLALPNAGEYLAAVAAEPAFDGLWCVARYTLGADDERSLTVEGILRDGRLWLKAVYPTGAGEFGEDTYAATPWPHEAALLAALYDFARTGRAAPPPPWVKENLFPDQRGRTVGGALTWMLNYPRAGSVGPFLQRVAVAVALLGVAVWGLTGRLLPDAPWAFAVLWSGALAVGALYLLYLVWLAATSMILLRSEMRRSHRVIYGGAVEHRRVDLAEFAPEAVNDPAVRKLTADVLALGAVHCADLTCVPDPSGRGVIRTFFLPEDDALLSLLFLLRSGGGDGQDDAMPRFHTCPAQYNLMLRTGFAGGWRLFSVSGGSGFRHPTGAPVIGRIHAGLLDPAAMLAKHRASVAAQEASGRRREALDPARVIEYLDHDQAEATEYAGRTPAFGWGDAYRMYFNIVLPCYRD